MSQILNEQLSALLDGELPAEQGSLLLRRLDADPELREKFGRLAMLGDVLTDPEIHPGALGIADRVREQLREAEVPAPRERRGTAVGPGLLGAGLAAAAALVVALNLDPTGGQSASPQLAGVAPVAITPAVAMVAQIDQQRANVAPERMTRYLVTHSEYSNSASRQFVDSHIVMPAFQRVAWQTAGTRP